MVTVVIPIYNVDRYLQRCIDSILCQKYENLDIILVDDGSSDLSSEFCDNNAKTDSRIRVIHKKNNGLSSARNIGIDFASGEYICFVDSDDWVHDCFVYYLYNTIIECDEIDIALCLFKKTDTEKIENMSLEIKKIVYTNIEACGELKNTENSIFTVSTNKLFRINLFDDIRFPIGRLHEDEFTTYKLLFKASKIVLIDIVLYYYYVRHNSIMHSPTLKSWIDGKNALVERMIFFKNHHMFEYARELFYNIEYYILHRIRSDPENKHIYYSVYNKLLLSAKGIIPTKILIIKIVKYLRKNHE